LAIQIKPKRDKESGEGDNAMDRKRRKKGKGYRKR